MPNTNMQLAVGTPVTINGYSDCRAAVVVKATPKKVTVQLCSAKLLNGPNSGEPDALKVTQGGFAAHTHGVQRWQVAPNPDGALHDFTLRKNGRWIAVGASANSPADNIVNGWHHHYDFNF